MSSTRFGRLSLLAAVLASVGILMAGSPPSADAQPADGEGTRLLRQPTVQDSLISFAYANDLWVVDRQGGTARRLTSFRGTESRPHFSPDGEWVAFTAEYSGDEDVYVVPTEGGSPRRLTWHPGADNVRGWTPDGERVLFASGRSSAPTPYDRLFTVAVDGGLPEPLAVPRGSAGDISPSGDRLAYQPVELGDRHWRNYRGGQARPIWILDRETYALEEVPGEERSRNIDPVWMDGTVYFLSDREGAMNVWAYRPGSDSLRQVTDHDRFGVVNVDAGGGALVYEQGGWIHLYEPGTGVSRQVDVEVRGDFPWARSQWKDVGDQLTEGTLSPSGDRALFEARGEILTVPSEEGDWRNLTTHSGAADRDPAWSPDGETVAWFSDREGEYGLYLGDPDGQEEPRRVQLEDPTFFYELEWAPDSRHLLFTDADRRLWVLDTETGEQTLVDQDEYTTFNRSLDPAFSPDSRWIAYAKRLDNKFRAIKVYSVERDTAFRVTEGMADAVSPAWDPGGDYLYFAASTDYSVHTGWGDMSTFDRPLNRGLYLAVLQEGEASPFLPEQEGGSAGGSEDQASPSDTAEGEGPSVRIDPDGLPKRIVALDVPQARYNHLRTADSGGLYYLERPQGITTLFAQPGTLHRYDLEQERVREVLSGVRTYEVAHEGNRLLYQAGGTWGIAPTGKPIEPGQGALDTDELRVRVDPEREWRQIFEEAWRIERDYFYVDNMHGADWPAVREAYGSWVDHVRHRSDLTYLLDLMGGRLAVGHSYTSPGDRPEVEEVPVGVLGAELEAENGHYRIRRIYSGANWTPDVEAPLARQGLEVSEGDYLLAVDGEAVAPPDNPYRALDGTAGRKTTLRVNDRPTREGSRQVTVRPVESDTELRQWSWVERKRQMVDSLSNGRLAYVYLPDTQMEGYRYFNRYYFAQQHKEGVVIDERFNGGGVFPDYMVDVMSRRLLGFFSNPTHPEKPFTVPGSGIWGPKVMVINEEAGSGGDLLPYLFRKQEVGPLVGRRTWGGLVGIWDTPGFVDGGSITAPRGGFYDLEGEWAVENEGVAPDIRVEQTPREVIRGGDPQLERAVEEALRLLEQEEWPRVRPRPEPPVRAGRSGEGG